MTDSLDVELGSVLSRAGGFGLANALSKAMEQRAQRGRPSTPPTALVPDASAPLKQPFRAAPCPSRQELSERPDLRFANRDRRSRGARTAG